MRAELVEVANNRQAWSERYDRPAGEALDDGLDDTRAAAAEEFFTRDVRTPEPLQGRQNIDIQTDQFVEELTDKAPCYEIGC